MGKCEQIVDNCDLDFVKIRQNLGVPISQISARLRASRRIKIRMLQVNNETLVFKYRSLYSPSVGWKITT